MFNILFKNFVAWVIGAGIMNFFHPLFLFPYLYFSIFWAVVLFFWILFYVGVKAGTKN